MDVWIRGKIRSSDPSLVVVAGIVLFRALLTVCLCTVSIIRMFSWCKSAMVIVVVILSIFVRNSTPFLLWLFFWSLRLQKNRTFPVIMSIKIVNWKSAPTDPNLITSWELGVIAKYCRCEGCLPSQPRTSPIPSGGELSTRFCRHSLRRTEDTSTRWCEYLARIS